MRCPANGEKIPNRPGFFLQKMIAIVKIPLPEKQQTAEICQAVSAQNRHPIIRTMSSAEAKKPCRESTHATAFAYSGILHNADRLSDGPPNPRRPPLENREERLNQGNVRKSSLTPLVCPTGSLVYP